MIKLRNLFYFILTIVCFWYQFLVSMSWALGICRRHIRLRVPVVHSEVLFFWGGTLYKFSHLLLITFDGSCKLIITASANCGFVCDIVNVITCRRHSIVFIMITIIIIMVWS